MATTLDQTLSARSRSTVRPPSPSSTTRAACPSDTRATGIDLDVAAAGNTEVIRAKLRTMAALGLDDKIEDILITLGQQYHLIRLLQGADGSGLFLYLVLDKGRANLALARRQLSNLERTLTI